MVVLLFLDIFQSRIDAFLEDVLIQSHQATQRKVPKVQKWPGNSFCYLVLFDHMLQFYDDMQISCQHVK